jgi:C-terminal processing protease CtpA/Prc
MKRLFLVLMASAALAGRAAEPVQFNELFDLLKANLVGASEADLNQSAVAGLLKQLGPRVSVTSDDAQADTNAAPLLTAAVFDKSYGYLRVGRVAAGLEKEFTNAVQRLLSTNKIKGLVLDLRFAGGQDYAAAVAVADQFFAGEQPLIDWGEGWKKSTSKPEAIVKPVTLLVNRQTSGAAEALAGMLRLSDVGLLIGTNTAGQASKSKEFTLKTGQRVRVAVAPVKVANERELSVAGLKPDIQVDVSPEDEQAWFEDAYKVLPKSGRLAAGGTNDMNLTVTNRPVRRRLNEAELVRMRNEGLNFDGEPTNNAARKAPSAVPIVNDPALARAIDLLKGLAVVQQFRSI